MSVPVTAFDDNGRLYPFSRVVSIGEVEKSPVESDKKPWKFDIEIDISGHSRRVVREFYEESAAKVSHVNMWRGFHSFLQAQLPK